MYYMCTYTYLHTCIHTYIYTYIHTCIHIYIYIERERERYTDPTRGLPTPRDGVEATLRIGHYAALQVYAACMEAL